MPDVAESLLEPGTHTFRREGPYALSTCPRTRLETDSAGSCIVMPAWARRLLIVLAAASVVCSLGLLLAVVLTGFDRSDAVASVLGALCAMIIGAVTLVTLVQRPSRTVAETVPIYNAELQGALNEKLKELGLEALLLPLRLVQRLRSSSQTGPAATFDLSGLQGSVVRSVMALRGSRIFIYGAPGAGKSTTALMLASGLLRVHTDKAPIVLLLSLDTWDGVMPVQDWLDRRLAQSFASLRPLATSKWSIIRRLMYQSSVVLLLDGLDSVPEHLRLDLIRAINEVVPAQQRVVVFSRYTLTRDHEAGFPTAAIAHLVPCAAGAVAEFYTKRALGTVQAAGWATVGGYLRNNRRSHLARALQTPWHAMLGWEVYGAANEQPTHLLALAGQPVAEIVTTLHERFLQTKIGAIDLARFPAALPTLAYVAHKMQKLGVRSFAWWQLYRALSNRILMVFAGLSVAPAYQLALNLPQGLTRGFAIGSTAGVCLGLLRGIPTSVRSGAIAGACALPVIAFIGLFTLAPQRVLIDGAQIALAVACVVGLKDRLIEGLGAIVLVPAVGAATAAAVEALLLVGVDSNRSAVGVFVSTTLGVGVAVLAVRLLADSSAPQPSRIVIGHRRRWRQLPVHLLVGVAASVPVGIAGGAAGALQQRSLAYGVTLTLVFGLVAGVPIGLVGGVIRWIRLSTSEPAAISPVSSLRNDRAVALGSIGAIGVVSAISIAVFGDALRRLDPVIASGPRIEWYHGCMFGLSLGLVVACLYTAWPTFVVYHLALGITGRAPWRFIAFFEGLRRHGVLRRDGALYQFHQESLQDTLDRHWHRPASRQPACATTTPRADD